jgi:purine-binding chemotaxis protein CheW
MVDLAKIRKKKAETRKQKAEAAVAEPAPVVQQPEPTQHSALSTQHSTEHSALSTQHSAPKLERFMAEAGKKREGFIREAAQTAAPAEVEVLTFVLAGEQYAVGIEHIVEIVRPRAATRVPNAGANVVGIISLRGLIVTVVDVRAKLHHPPAPAGADARIIVVELGGETLGFQVDRVLRVVKLDATAIEPHPVVHSSELTEAIRGVFQHAGALTILLDLDKLLA